MHANTNGPTVNICKKPSCRLLLTVLRLSLVQLFGRISGECPALVNQHCSGPFFLVCLFHRYLDGNVRQSMMSVIDKVIDQTEKLLTRRFCE